MSKTQSKKIVVEIYSKPDCHLCHEALDIIKKTKNRVSFELIEIDINKSSEIFEKYKEEIPVILINGRKAFKYVVTEEEFIRKLTHRDL